MRCADYSNLLQFILDFWQQICKKMGWPQPAARISAEKETSSPFLTNQAAPQEPCGAALISRINTWMESSDYSASARALASAMAFSWAAGGHSS